MNTNYLVMSIIVMALTTYIIRVTPMVVFRKKITNVFVRSFLYYVPYAVLSAMTFPEIFASTGTIASATAGCVVAIILAYFKRGLMTVAVGAAATVFLVSMIGF